jgi:hypothetical protein
LIIDDAYYTAQPIAGTPQLALAQERARQTLATLAPGSKAACFTTTTYADRLSIDLGFVRQTIDSLTPRTTHGTLRQAVDAAAQLLQAEAPELPHLIVVISDLNHGVLRPEDGHLRAPDAVRLELVELPVREHNAYIREVRLAPAGEVVRNRTLSATAQVGGGDALLGARISLWVNGRRQATRSIQQLDAQGHGSVTFELRPDQVGSFAAELRLDQQDTLPDDDSWFFAAPVVPPADILLIGAPDSPAISTAEVVEAALAPPAWHGRQRYRVRLVSSTYAEDELPLTEDAVIVAGAAVPSSDFWVGLHAYVEGGGGVMITADTTTPIGRLNGGAMPLLPGATQAWTLPEPALLQQAAGSPLSKRLMRQAGGALRRATFSATCCWAETAAQQLGVEPLLWYTDNTLAAGIKHVGRGRSLFCGIPIIGSDPPLFENEGFAPMLHTLLDALLAAPGETRNQLCGAPMIVRGAPGDTTTVHLPNGSIVHLAASDFVDGERVFDDTSMPGHYTIADAREPRRIAVNVHRSDRFFMYADAGMREQQHAALAAANAKTAAAAPAAVATEKDWPAAPLGMALIAFLLAAELTLANRRW